MMTVHISDNLFVQPIQKAFNFLPHIHRNAHGNVGYE